MINDLASRMGLNNKDCSGTCVSMNTVAEVIPRKSKVNGKHRGGTSAAAGSAMHSGDAEDAQGGGCALCKKYSTNSLNALKPHSTSDYKR